MKKLPIILLIIIIILSIAYFVYSYPKPINNDTEQNIKLVIEESKKQYPDLQTWNTQYSWTNKGLEKQKKMMDIILSNLTVKGKSRKSKPIIHIVATYNNMRLYIPSLSISPENNIIIKIDSEYYVAKGKTEDVKKIIKYIKSQR